jgi:hypothetical protein
LAAAISKSEFPTRRETRRLVASSSSFANSEKRTRRGLGFTTTSKPGYAERVYGDDGEPIREQIIVNGMKKFDFKRGEPLTDEQLKKKNNYIAMKARKDIIGAVVAAYMIEANGGDLDAVKNAFRLQKYEPSRDGVAADADAADTSDGIDTKEAATAPIVKPTAAPGTGLGG